MDETTERVFSGKQKSSGEASRSAATQSGAATALVDNRSQAQQLAQMKAAVDRVERPAGAAAIAQRAASRLPSHLDRESQEPGDAETSEAAPVQRLPSAAEFLAASYVGKTSSRGDTLKEVDEWLAEYHVIGPTAAKDTRLGVLDEIIETAQLWLDQNPNSGTASAAVQKRFPEVASLLAQAKAEKRTVAAEPAGLAAAGTKVDPKTTKVNSKLTGDFKQASEHLAGLIDLAVPQNDTSAELEVELAVPVGSGVEVGFHFDAEAERDDEAEIEVGLALGVTAGGSIGIAKLQAELGGFLEAKAGTSSDVMKLLSYAMFQRFRESSVLPREVANYMWGGSTSAKGQKLAERWAAGVEKNVLDAAEGKERFVKRGAYLAGKIEGGVTGGKLGAGMKGRHFTEYTKKSIEAKTGGKKLSELSVKELAKLRMPSARGARASLGETQMEGVLGFEMEFGPFSGELEYTMAADSSELEGTALAKFNLLELGGGGAAAALAGYIGNMVVRMSPLLADKAQENEQPASTAVGMVGDFASSVETMATALKGDPEIKFETFDPEKEVETSRKSEIGIEAGFKVKEKDFKRESWEITITAKQSKGIESAIINVSFEQGKLIKKWGGK